jgi:hypothetical protein
MTAANRSGQTFEGIIEDALTRKGVTADFQCALAERSIFSKRIRVDVKIDPCPAFPDGLIIEGKWQHTTGSVEEKLPYLVMNIRQRYPYPAIIIIDGSGFSEGALAWLRDQIDGHLLAVFSLREFVSWLNRGI